MTLYGFSIGFSISQSGYRFSTVSAHSQRGELDYVRLHEISLGTALLFNAIQLQRRQRQKTDLENQGSMASWCRSYSEGLCRTVDDTGDGAGRVEPNLPEAARRLCRSEAKAASESGRESWQ